MHFSEFAYWGWSNYIHKCQTLFKCNILINSKKSNNSDRYISNIIIVSPVRSTYGGYYGLVVVTPRPRPPRPRPRPQTLHRSHDNLENPYRIASIFYM